MTQIRIKVILTLDYGEEAPWDLEEAINELKLEHPNADIIIEDYFFDTHKTHKDERDE